MFCTLKFDYKKATQALNFFAIKCGGKIDKMKALKLIFFADRYHIRKYSSTITNDEYFAMERGPVASGVKDIAEKSGFLGEEEIEYSDKFIRPHGNFNIRSISAVEESVFSESELEALEFSFAAFGEEGPFIISDITHKYPEWKKHENSLLTSACSRMLINYNDFFEDPEEGLEKCYELSEEEKNDRLDEFKEINILESFWR